jgi:hypothetical protein
MASRLKYVGTVDPNHPFEVRLQYRWWPLLLSDQWFLPRFKLRVANLGKEVQRGSVDIYITEFKNVKELGQLGIYSGPFQDVTHRQITQLLPGKHVNLRFTIGSRFLRPGEYVLRIVLNEWIPSDSPIRELMEQLRKHNVEEPRGSALRQFAENQMREMGVDPYAVPRDQYKRSQLFDLRFVERLKIHSLTSAATIIGVFTGSALAAAGALGALLYRAIRILQENWGTIRAVLR